MKEFRDLTFLLFDLNFFFKMQGTFPFLGGNIPPSSFIAFPFFGAWGNVPKHPHAPKAQGSVGTRFPGGGTCPCGTPKMARRDFTKLTS